MSYIMPIFEVRRTPEFQRWLDGLADPRAFARIEIRLTRLALGNPGGTKPIRQGVCEMRIDYGPGYRVYFTRRGKTLFYLLAGGDKSTQHQDIKAALKMALLY